MLKSKQGDLSGANLHSQFPIGLHVGDNQSLATVHNEYSHFQNQTLKELADSRTISLDRAEPQILKSEEMLESGGTR